MSNYRVLAHGLPFGGFKESGLGRENGLEALHEYTELKSVWIDTGNEIRFAYGDAAAGRSGSENREA